MSPLKAKSYSDQRALGIMMELPFVRTLIVEILVSQLRSSKHEMMINLMCPSCDRCRSNVPSNALLALSRIAARVNSLQLQGQFP